MVHGCLALRLEKNQDRGLAHLSPPAVSIRSRSQNTAAGIVHRLQQRPYLQDFARLIRVQRPHETVSPRLNRGLNGAVSSVYPEITLKEARAEEEELPDMDLLASFSSEATTRR